jgi:predicted Zn-dependent protease
MSEAQEIALGEQGDQSILAQYGEYDDPELKALVEDIGQRMVPISHRPSLDFHFRLLDDSIVNAFALPGGYVYITRGILAYLNDEAGLAGVMGHEIGHVTARHSVQQYTQQTLFGTGMLLGAILSPELAEYMQIAGAGAQMLLLKYGRDDERQSDQLGVEYATKTGYDTESMAEFFHTLDRLTGGVEGRLPEWQSTHPDPGGRYTTVQSLTTRWQNQVGRPPYETRRDEYLDLIDGLVFGDDPRKGYLEGQRFYHPEMAFEFPVPRGWKVQNTAVQVAVYPRDESMVVLLRHDSHESADAAADALSEEGGAQIEDRESYRIGNKPSVRVRFRDNAGQRVIATYIEHRDDLVLAFYGVGATSSSELNLVALPADGFRETTDPAVLNKQPIRVKVIRASRAGAFLEVVAGYPVPEGSQLTTEGLALLNGLPVNSWIERGTRLKVLVRD